MSGLPLCPAVSLNTEYTCIHKIYSTHSGLYRIAILGGGANLESNIFVFKV